MDPLPHFKRYVFYSLTFHALLLVLFFLFQHQIETRPLPNTQVTMIRLIKGSGDLNAPLFEKSDANEGGSPIPTAKKVEPTEVKPKEEVKPTSVVKPVEKKPEPKATEKVVQLNQQKKKPMETSATKPTPNIPKKPSPEDAKIAQALGQVEGELQQREQQSQQGGSGGGSGSGSVPAFGSPEGTVTTQDPEIARYRSQVRAKIIREWIKTSVGEQEQILRTRIVVRIDGSGGVISKNIAKSSNDPSFDSSALRAVERASPFPPPPEGIRAEALNEGFVVDFSSRMLGRPS